MKFNSGKKIYIACKISSIDYHKTFKKFLAVEEMLMLLGYEVFNPMKIIPKNEGWKNKILLSFSVMHKCDAIYYLPDWRESKDAKLESKFANKIGLKPINNCIINTIQSKIKTAEKNL